MGMNNDCKVCGFPFDYQHTHETCVFKLNQEIERLKSLTQWVGCDVYLPPLDQRGFDSTMVSEVVNVIRLLNKFESEDQKYDTGYFTKDGWNNYAGNRIFVTYWQPKLLPPEGVK